LSEIRATTISDAAGTGPVTLTKQSAAKAWLNMDGTGTIAIRDSFNTSSIVDDATGKYSQYYISNMSSDDYSVSTSSANSAGYIESIKVNRYNVFEPIYTNGMQVACWNNNSAWTDTQFVLLQSFGDLA
jgi:hypothetical protein